MTLYDFGASSSEEQARIVQRFLVVLEAGPVGGNGTFLSGGGGDLFHKHGVFDPNLGL